MSIRFSQLVMLNVLLLIPLCVTVYAETATDEIDVYSGLAPVMMLTCTDLNFGVYQIARGDRGISGDTSATLNWSLVYDRDSSSDVMTAEISFTNAGLDSIALSDKPEYDAPAPAVCTVSGSRVINSNIGVSSSVSGTFPFAGTGGNPFATTLAIPNSGVTGMEGRMTVPATVALDANGSGTFVITGQVWIPNNLSADNYGSYKGQAVTITVNDGL